jgi:hypothetical protein
MRRSLRKTKESFGRHAIEIDSAPRVAVTTKDALLAVMNAEENWRRKKI